MSPAEDIDALPNDAVITPLGELKESMTGRTVVFNMLAASPVRASGKGNVLGPEPKQPTLLSDAFCPVLEPALDETRWGLCGTSAVQRKPVCARGVMMPAD